MLLLLLTCPGLFQRLLQLREGELGQVQGSPIALQERADHGEIWPGTHRTGNYRGSLRLRTSSRHLGLWRGREGGGGKRVQRARAFPQSLKVLLSCTRARAQARIRETERVPWR
ncbi:hypothetical protein XELAEV_18013889mg [Xenopus laevis]|uniref:Secreted protein n=1 Tax=Xenopus laevis TaxID=8355 RepID=A0A974HZK9_XENLA|nr:hypothetical protein XELAEV_18013889mg [Xenopus laevis]